MVITIKQALNLHNGVKALSELETGRTPIRLVFPGAVRYKLAKNAKVLNEVVEVFQKVRDSLVEKYGTVNEETKQSSIDPNGPNWKLFTKEAEQLLSEQEDLNIHTITLAELNLDGNPIPISIIDQIMAIIED